MNRRDLSEELEDLQNWGAGNLARGRWQRHDDTLRRPKERHGSREEANGKRQQRRHH